MKQLLTTTTEEIIIYSKNSSVTPIYPVPFKQHNSRNNFV